MGLGQSGTATGVGGVPGVPKRHLRPGIAGTFPSALTGHHLMFSQTSGSNLKSEMLRVSVEAQGVQAWVFWGSSHCGGLAGQSSPSLGHRELLLAIHTLLQSWAPTHILEKPSSLEFTKLYELLSVSLPGHVPDTGDGSWSLCCPGTSCQRLHSISVLRAGGEGVDQCLQLLPGASHLLPAGPAPGASPHF